WATGLNANGDYTFDSIAGASHKVTMPILEVRGGSDIAEPYTIAPAGETAPIAGMVVAIDPDQVGKLRVCARAYDRAVAGIISGANGVNTGLTLTQKDSVADGSLPVASTGRVGCFVYAARGGAGKP